MSKKVATCLAAVLICFLALPIHSSVQKKIHVKEKRSFSETVYGTLATCADKTWRLVKNHPYITALAVITIVSKKMRGMIRHLPENLWEDAQDYPLAMAILGGLLLNYIISD